MYKLTYIFLKIGFSNFYIEINIYNWIFFFIMEKIALKKIYLFISFQNDLSV